MKYLLPLLALFVAVACNTNAQKGVQTPEAPRAKLLQPGASVEQAPPSFKARFVTTKGDFVMQVHREWAPAGADRFYNLVKIGYYDNVALFRAVKGFMVQTGLHGSPAVNQKWRAALIQDDPRTQSNKRGFVTFAKAGPSSRTTQFFINFVDNARLDGMGFAPFAEVVDGMAIVDKINTDYGDAPPAGRGPDQAKILDEGNAYLEREFPALDYIRFAKIEP